MSQPFYNFILIFIGGGIGAYLRFWLANLVDQCFEFSFPFGTISVNVIGSFFIGIFFCLLIISDKEMPNLKLLFMTGFLGGFTTFSTFSLESIQMWQKGEVYNVSIYILSSVFLSLLSTLMGMSITKTLFEKIYQ